MRIKVSVIVLGVLIGGLALSGFTAAQENGDSSFVPSPEVKEVYDQLLSDPTVIEGFEFIESDRENTIEDQIEISEVPAPTVWLDQPKRGKYYKQRLEELGLDDVQRDEVGNVFGVLPGSGNGPKVVVSAHLDTVFAEGVDFSVTRDGDILHGPGIGDDASGLAAMLGIIRALKENDIQHIGDIVFLATVMEEGLRGDLGGIKHFMQEHDDIDAFIGLEPGRPHRITNVFQGSIRTEVTYEGPSTILRAEWSCFLYETGDY